MRPAPAVQTRLGRDGVGGVGGEARRGAGTCMMQPLVLSLLTSRLGIFAVRLISTENLLSRSPSPVCSVKRGQPARFLSRRTPEAARASATVPTSREVL